MSQPEFHRRYHNYPDDVKFDLVELLAEVAHSTRSIDVYQKRRDYRRAGVRA